MKNSSIFTHTSSSINFDPRVRHTLWSVFIGNLVNAVNRYGFTQVQIQRYMCVKSTHGARQALLINSIGIALMISLSSVMGVVIYAHYADCDPLTAGYINKIDQIFPYFVMEVLGSIKGLPGIFLACIFSGSLSTISSGLNSLAATMIEDVYKGLLEQQMTDEKQGIVSKIFSFFLGIVVMALTYIVSNLGSLINSVLSLSGILSGPVMGIFILGFFFPRIGASDALIGLLGSTAITVWIFLGAQFTKNQRKDGRLSLSTADCTGLNTTKLITTNITEIHNSTRYVYKFTVQILCYLKHYRNQISLCILN